MTAKTKSQKDSTSTWRLYLRLWKTVVTFPVWARRKYKSARKSDQYFCKGVFLMTLAFGLGLLPLHGILPELFVPLIFLVVVPLIVVQFKLAWGVDC